jgi:UDP-glucose 4-epimerase
MNILITGSSGQIGTNLALRLADHNIIGVDQRRNTWRSIPSIKYDLADGTRLDLCAGLDIVVHLAANARVWESVVDPLLARDNIAMTFNVLEFCRRNELPIIFASSREVYGNNQKIPVGEHRSRFATAESPYAASKMACESLIHSYAASYGLRYVILRLSNVYGRYDCDIERVPRVIPLFIHQIRGGAPVTVFGEDKLLDFTHVDDCVDGIVATIDYLAGGGKNMTANLGTGEGHSIVEVALFAGDALGIKPEIKIEKSRTGEVVRYVADIKRARTKLGYYPRVLLKEGIERAVEWQREWQGW